MPTMSDDYCSYFAPRFESDEEVWTCHILIHRDIAEFDASCANIGLKRGQHYTISISSETNISTVINGESFRYPCEVLIYQVKFRNKNCLDLALSLGIVADGKGDGAGF